MCFSTAWLVNFLVWLVVVCGAAALIMLVLPTLLAWLGWGGDLVLRALKIIVAVIVIIALIYFIADLALCASGPGLRVR